MKKILGNLLRIAISFGILSYLVLTNDISEILAVLKGVEMPLFALALAIFLVALLLFSLRWQVLLTFSGIRLPYHRLVGYYFVGYFLNNFLPTMIGGDIGRAYFVARDSGRQADAVGIILLERILGILATLTLASIATFWAFRQFDSGLILLITIALLALVAFFLLNLLNTRLHHFSLRLLEKLTILGLGERISEILTKIYAFREGKRQVVIAFLLSLGCQLLLIGMNYALALSLHIEVSFGYLMFVIPATFVMGLIPSINGIGVRDAGYNTLLGAVGVDSPAAISLSFLNTLVPMLMSLVGGVLLVWLKRKDPGASISSIAE
ncbi:MAG TPA: lysylphosphatidylglycerol synthase transmembrane domain-containing protein [Calditrichia bacterium]|nr:lysylphosphatidylglycerol synthase transmembrane domain-containing protein [Calditrichia bacterium]HQV34308.1 lysylphosphatidylglycerol synthase transmembrane domain-containing protein [Calditrichia bacterium]